MNLTMTLTVPFLRDEDGNAINTPCRGADELFVGGTYIDPPAKDQEHAKSLCRTCPVMAACQEWALTQGEPYGVWGGLAAHERRELRKRRGWAAVEE